MGIAICNKLCWPRANAMGLMVLVSLGPWFGGFAWAQHRYEWKAPEHLMAIGDNEFGQALPGGASTLERATLWRAAPRDLVQLALGARHSLGVDKQGRVWAWGDNSSGQGGQGHTRPLSEPMVVVLPNCHAQEVAAGAQHSLARCKDGSVWSWGGNNAGQLGRGAANAFAPPGPPAKIGTIDHAVAIAAAEAYSGVVRTSATGKKRTASASKWELWVWGAGSTTPRRVSVSKLALDVRSNGQVLLYKEGNQYIALEWANGKWNNTRRLSVKDWDAAEQFAMQAPPPPPPIASAADKAAASRPAPAAAKPASPTLAAVVALDAKPASATTTKPIPRGDPPAPVANATAPIAVATIVTPPVAPPAATAASQAVLPRTDVRPAPTSIGVETHVAKASTIVISGRVSAAGSAVADATVLADGQACAKTDTSGSYRCTLPMGWSGRLLAQKPGFRVSPNALRFAPLQSDVTGQNFSAVFDPQ